MYANFVQQGDVRLFSHFESEEFMWSSSGDRQVIWRVNFERPFQEIPVIQLNVTLMDAASDQHMRYSLGAENVATDGFEIVFRTWLDSRFARVWVNWLAIGEARDPEMWDNL